MNQTTILKIFAVAVLGAAAATAQPTRFVYAISDGELTVMPVDPLNGTLGPSISTTTLRLRGARHLAVDPTARFLWISHALSSPVGGAVTIYRINADGQAATLVQTLQFSHPVDMVAFEPTGRFAYVSSHLGLAGALSVYRVSASTGSADLLWTVTTNPPKRLEIDPSGRFLIALTAADQSAVYRLDVGNGKPTLAGTPLQFTAPGSPADLAAHPAGRFVSVSFPDRIVLHNIDTQIQGVGFSVPVAKPTRLAVHPTGRFVFGVSPGNRTVYSLRVEAVTNGFTVLAGTLSAVPATDLALDPSGRFLYTAGPEGVAVIEINLAHGGLTLRQTQNATRDVVQLRLASPNERFLYSTYSTRTLPARINAANGDLTPAPEQLYSLRTAAVDPATRFLVTAPSLSSLFTLRIDAAQNSLGTSAQVPPLNPVSSLAFDPTGGYLMTACSVPDACGSHVVASYRVRPEDGGLTALGWLNAFLTAQTSPEGSRVVFDPNGRWAYVTQTSTGGFRLAVVRHNYADGSLGVIQHQDFVKRRVLDIAVDSTSLTSPASQSLYVLHQEEDDFVILSRFLVNQVQTGGLWVPLAEQANFTQTISCGGCDWGRLLTHPTGRFLFVATGRGSTRSSLHSFRTDTFPLTLQETYSFNSNSFNSSEGVLSAAAAAEPTGRYLYFGTWSKSVMKMTVNPYTGRLSSAKALDVPENASALHATGRFR
jgi:6-phosphogluconolactonase (cycloisomerase 2 family)